MSFNVITLSMKFFRLKIYILIKYISNGNKVSLTLFYQLSMCLPSSVLSFQSICLFIPPHRFIKQKYPYTFVTLTD